MSTNIHIHQRSTSRLYNRTSICSRLTDHLTFCLQAGALFATGILNTGVRTEADAALALLGEHTENKSVPLKTSAIMGLGLAYAGSHREDILPFLLPHVADDAATMEISSLAALALGFIFVGSENGEVTGTILQTFMEKFDREEDRSLDERWARFMALGLGLLYLGESNTRLADWRIFMRGTGLQDASDATIETLKAIDHPIAKTAQIMVEACAYAGTGNVLKIQAMLHHCDEHINPAGDKDKEKETTDDNKDNEKKDESKEEPTRDDTFQAFAVLAVSLIAMGEDIGAEMSLRQFNHLVC